MIPTVIDWKGLLAFIKSDYGISVSKIARDIGIHENTIHNWRYGERDGNLKYSALVYNYLFVRIDYDEMKPFLTYPE